LAAALIAIAVGVAALVAGGDEGTGPTGADAVAEAAERTGKAKGLRYTLSGTAENPQLGRPVTMRGEGVSDIAGQRSHARIDMPEMAEIMRDAGEDGELTDPDTWQMEMFMDGRVMYMKFPLAEKGLGGKSWAKMDLIKTSEALGIDPALMRASQQQGDPTLMLRQLRTVSDEVETVGTENVRGVETTHYRATVNLRKYPEIVPEADREKVRRSIDKLVELSGGHETSQTEIWVGKDKLVRRMKMEQYMKQPGQSDVTRNNFTMEFTDYDAQVDVQPPDADDVRDITEETAAQLAAQSGTP
jgi:hypothetical protein